MDFYTAEDQQVEALKQWWKENGKSVILGLALGLAAVFGWRGWLAYQQHLGKQASAQYEHLMQLVQRGEVDQARARGTQIIQEFDATAYAFFSALALARLEVEQGQLDAAHKHLKWAYDHAPQEPLEHVARLRLARVMLAQGQAQEALALVTTKNGDAFVAQYQEIAGDAYFALGQGEQAQKAYAKALQAANAENRERLQMKLDNLGGGQAS